MSGAAAGDQPAPAAAPDLQSALAATAWGALAALLAVILASLFRVQSVPWPVPLALAAFAAFAAWRPAAALLVVAAATPLASVAGHHWSYQVAWAEAIVIAFAAGWAVRRIARRSEGALAPSLRLPIGVFALVVTASLVVELSVEQMRVGTSGFGELLWRYFSLDYFVSGPDQYLHAGALLLEGLLLLSVAARAAAADAGAVGRLARVLAAATAIAALVNLEALVESAHRSAHFWALLAQHVRTTRINVHYGDVNAAGSHFAMVVFVAAALAIGRRRTGRAWAVAAAALALGIWMSGSRAALFACPLALAIGAGAMAHARGDRRTRMAAAGAGAALAVAALLLLVYAPMRANQTSSSIAALVRVEMARTTIRMVEASPVFGIGIGQFYQRSGEFSSPALLQAFPRAVHENAHNNFLQILAETGIAGFAVFVWLLAAAMRAGWIHAREPRADLIVWGCLTGLTAFLLTWLAGHPLLTREPAYAFWMLLGATAGPAASLAAAGVRTTGPSFRARHAPTAAALLLIASLPFRTAAARAQADLEHQGIGLSTHWETADGGVRYRSAVNAASIFVPAETGFRFQVRALSDRSERLELRLGGRLADIVALLPDRWTTIIMPARSDRSETRYTTIDLRLVDAGGRSVTLWISKVEPLGR